MYLSAADDTAPPTMHGMPTSTWPMAPATMQPSASAVWPAWPHHSVLRADAGPLVLSCSMDAMASRRTLPSSKVSAASITSVRTTFVSLVSNCMDAFSILSSAGSREALVASVSLAMLPTVSRSTLLPSLAHSRIDTMRSTGSKEPVAKYLPHNMSSGPAPTSSGMASSRGSLPETNRSISTLRAGMRSENLASSSLHLGWLEWAMARTIATWSSGGRGNILAISASAFLGLASITPAMKPT